METSLKHRLAFSAILFLFFSFFTITDCKAQFYSVQTNVVQWGMGTLNAEGSMALSRNWTLNVRLSCNPWTLKDNKKIKHWLVEPGARYWLWQSYVGRFVGIYGIGARYNMGWKKNRYDGRAFGVGASYGYTWLLGRRWNLEAEAGIGAVVARHSKYECNYCGEYLSQGTYLLPVPKLALNLVYLF